MLKVKWGIQVGKRFIAQEFIFMPTFMLWSWTPFIITFGLVFLLIISLSAIGYTKLAFQTLGPEPVEHSASTLPYCVYFPPFVK